MNFFIGSFFSISNEELIAVSETIGLDKYGNKAG